MRFKALLLFAGLFFSLTVFSQTSPIQIEKAGLGQKYSRDGSMLNLDQLQSIVSGNTEAAVLMKKVKTNIFIANALGGVGGACMGWPIGGALAGAEMNWTLFAVGAGIVAVTIPISISASKKTKEAVEIYNSFFQSGYWNSHPELKIEAGNYGYGLVLTF